MSPVSAWALVVGKRQQTCSALPSHLFILNEELRLSECGMCTSCPVSHVFSSAL